MTAPDPLDRLYKALLQAQQRHHLFPRAAGDTPHPVIVGVSGGADSVCLLHLLVGLARPWHLALHVAHLDHNVRPDSAEDAAFVKELADRFGLLFHTRRLSPEEIGEADSNLEAGLRQLRYAFFADVAGSLTSTSDCQSDVHLPTIAVAHNADDQAETILMHVLRGSGLAGLAGMRPVTDLPSSPTQRPLRLVRPLLDVPRTQILQYLDDHEIAWREDPSNREMRFARNWLRHQILPELRKLYPNLTPALARLGAVMADESDRAERINAEAFQRLRQPNEPAATTAPPVRIVLDRAGFRGLDVATQRGVLRLAADALGLLSEDMHYERTEGLRIALIGADSPNALPLAGQIVWSAEDSRFSLHQKAALAFQPDTPFLDDDWRSQHTTLALAVDGEIAVAGWRLTCRSVEMADLPADWRAINDPWQVWCDGSQVDGLGLTTPQRGQRFAPLGLAGGHKNIGDLFTDNKVPVELRAGWPVLVDGRSGEVVWLCGLRLAHHVRIRPETEQILHLHWRAI